METASTGVLSTVITSKMLQGVLDEIVGIITLCVSLLKIKTRVEVFSTLLF